MEYAYPLLDRRLWDFTLRLSPAQPAAFGGMRPFFVRAGRDWLPQDVAWASTKDDGPGFFTLEPLRSALRNWDEESKASGALVDRSALSRAIRHPGLRGTGQILEALQVLSLQATE